MTLVTTIAVFAVTLAAPSQPPATAASARDHFADAERLFEENNYAEAVRKFHAAYLAQPHPALFFNIAKCYQLLGDEPRALDSYQRYLAQMPAADDRDLVAAAVVELRQSLRRRGEQLLIVRVTPAEAEVTVDGVVVASPVAVAVRPGAHRVSARLGGRDPVERALRVDAGAETLELALSLPSDAPARRTWVYVATSTSAVALLSGAGLGMGALSARGELLSREHSGARAQQLHETAVGRAAGANVSYGIAAAAAATALVLYWMEKSSSSGAQP